MDSVTQIALGAAIGELVLGKKIGWRAALAGGVLGTLPDLDVFIPLGDPVSDFTYHRSATHSLFVLSLAAPVLAELLIRWQDRSRSHAGLWHLMVFLVLFTHPLLDSLTVYGTQLFWPFSSTPVGWGTVFIIDPVYTVPLILGVVSALILQRSGLTGHRLNTCGLVLSTAYLAATIAAKQQATQVARQELEKAGIGYTQVIAMAGPFSSLFWRIVAIDGDTYYNAYYSILDDESHRLQFTPHERNPGLLKGLENDWATQRLIWFTKGYYAVRNVNGSIVLSDLRMGFEPNYVFTFKLATMANPHAVALPKPQRVPVVQDVTGVGWIWDRIWSPDVVNLP